MQYLEEQHIGFDTRICKVPLVVESCIYDLGCGDNVRPDAAMGYAACQASESGDFRQGCYGAGTGATVGKLCGPDYMMKSGLGAYAVQVGDLQVGAVVAVNAVGDVLDENGQILAGMRSRDCRYAAGHARRSRPDADPLFPARRRDDDQYDYRCRRHQWAVRQGPAEKNRRPRQQRPCPDHPSRQYDGGRRFSLCRQCWQR
jgi:hypothetical protein